MHLCAGQIRNIRLWSSAWFSDSGRRKSNQHDSFSCAIVLAAFDVFQKLTYAWAQIYYRYVWEPVECCTIFHDRVYTRKRTVERCSSGSVMSFTSNWIKAVLPIFSLSTVCRAFVQLGWKTLWTCLRSILFLWFVAGITSIHEWSANCASRQEGFYYSRELRWLAAFHTVLRYPTGHLLIAL